MAEVTTEFKCEVPQATSAEQIENELNKSLALSQEELAAILDRYADSHKFTAKDIAGVVTQRVTVQEKGSGFEPATVAILISLAPVIKALMPILEPFAKAGANVAEKVAMDVWEMLKTKMWGDHHIRLHRR